MGRMHSVGGCRVVGGADVAPEQAADGGQAVGSGGRNCHEAAGAYLSGCNDGDVAPGGGYERQKTALVGCGDRRGGDRGVTHLGSGGCVLLTFMLSMASVGV